MPNYTSDGNGWKLVPAATPQKQSVQESPSDANKTRVEPIYEPVNINPKSKEKNSEKKEVKKKGRPKTNQ